MSLEDLRQKPVATRRKMAIALTVSIMFIICAIGFTLPDFSKENSSKKTGESPIKAFSSMFSNIKEKFGNPLNAGGSGNTDPETSELIFQLINGNPETAPGALGAGVDNASTTEEGQNSLENEGFPVPPAPSNPDEFML